MFFAVVHGLGGERGEALFVGVEHLLDDEVDVVLHGGAVFLFLAVLVETGEVVARVLLLLLLL